MPGQQMSIDADLNMGLIDQKEAVRRREELEKEASFYGAMDGASKFVKGDAIAGIIILLINIIAGWIVGVSQMGMEWPEALQHFTLLTIGDGIATQLPALIISIATGIIVTRARRRTASFHRSVPPAGVRAAHPADRRGRCCWRLAADAGHAEMADPADRRGRRLSHGGASAAAPPRWPMPRRTRPTRRRHRATAPLPAVEIRFGSELGRALGQGRRPDPRAPRRAAPGAGTELGIGFPAVKLVDGQGLRQLRI